MDSLTKFNTNKPLSFSLRHSRSSLSASPISSISFFNPQFSRPSFSLKLRSPNSPSMAVTCQSSSSKPKNPLSLLKTPFTIAVAATAIFFSRLGQPPLTARAQAPPPPTEEERAAEEEGEEDGGSFEEREKKLEEFVAAHPDDVQALKSLMEAKIKNKKLPEAVEVVNRLIEVEPEDGEWSLLRCHMYSYMGESEIAKMGFEDIIGKEPYRVEAYHGLVMAVSQGENESKELEQVRDRIEEAMERCKREKRKDEVRDFKLLIAQIRVIQGNYVEALKVYQELVKEEPRDFRPYLCQGIIYTLLRKKDEAQKQFDKYKKLVPKGHPYAKYFDDNMLATKVFSQMAENERVKNEV